MNCIFCKLDSTNSTSVEHIIPESLWNTKQILPAGIVCDKCNNYFARKVEKPFLCSPLMESLRFNQAIPNKKGKIPSIKGIIPGCKHPIFAHRNLNEDPKLFVDIHTEDFDKILNGEVNTLIFHAGLEIPEGKEVSRFLAKVALEAIAQRLMGTEGGVQYIVEESQFDPIRNHARIGQPVDWKYSSRRIYDSNKQWEKEKEKGQIVHEYDFLQTDLGEMYFVLALYGIEFSINMAGPEIEGYENWLKEKNNVSPLYYGKNKIC